MKYYELRKADLASDDGYVSVVVQAHNILSAMISINRHLANLDREDLQLVDTAEITRVSPSEFGVIYSNVQRIPKAKLNPDGNPDNNFGYGPNEM